MTGEKAINIFLFTSLRLRGNICIYYSNIIHVRILRKQPGREEGSERPGESILRKVWLDNAQLRNFYAQRLQHS